MSRWLSSLSVFRLCVIIECVFSRHGMHRPESEQIDKHYNLFSQVHVLRFSLTESNLLFQYVHYGEYARKWKARQSLSGHSV